MSIAGCRFLALLLLSGTFIAAPVARGQEAQGSAEASTGIYPQIVRVSYVEGDVRVSRGKEGEKADHALWEKAAIDLPLEAGFSLVTGTGRAEIEFEDASTVYLGENSVLVFNELSTLGAIPRTQLGLLSGVMTLHVKPMAAGEMFRVSTPADEIAVRYPQGSYARINSYLDAMTVTPQTDSMLHLNDAVITSGAKATIVMRTGSRPAVDASADAHVFSDWDAWVRERVTARDAAMSSVMKESGLPGPIPGLAEMNRQGTFYPCAPYGTCWEPTQGWAPPQQQVQTPAPQPAEVTRQTVSVTQLQHGGALPNQAGQTGQTGTRAPGRQVVEDNYFPCSPYGVRNLYDIDPLTGKKRLIFSQMLGPGYRTGLPGGLMTAGYPYQWAVCHAGTWIRHRGHYAWVAGYKRHHHHPVHWVKTAHGAGYVPIHPRDVAGKLPVNLKDGVLHPVDKRGEAVERIAYAEGEPVKLLAEAPKGFRQADFPPLERAEAPHAEARSLKGADADTKVATMPITFDHKTQSFMVARQVTQGGGAVKTVVEPIGGRGTAAQAYSQIARGGGYVAGSFGGGVARGATSSSYSGGANASHVSAPAASAPSAPAASFSAPAVASSSAASSSSSGKH